MNKTIVLANVVTLIVMTGCSVTHSRVPIPKEAFSVNYGAMFDAAIVSGSALRYHPVQQDARLGLIKLMKESSGGASAGGTTYTINIAFKKGDDGEQAGVEVLGDASGPVDNPLTLMNPIIGHDTEQIKEAILQAARK